MKRQKVSRRHVLGALGTGFVAVAAGCGGSSPTSPTTSTSTGSTTSDGTTTGGSTTTGSCAVSPDETAGPYPDRTGMIGNPAFYREDITEGKSGLPLTLALTIVNVNNACGPVSNATVEIWQCDADGNYSEYSQPGYNGTGKTFLRGLQVSDSSGKATFRTIYPGWYQGRATHIHVEVFVSGASVKTTQIAFPENVTTAVYQTGVYASSRIRPRRPMTTYSAMGPIMSWCRSLEIPVPAIPDRSQSAWRSDSDWAHAVRPYGSLKIATCGVPSARMYPRYIP
jgi:protocatechuate 3,4-dioxygenase beta subunit